ncbi:hypothetical protein BAU07_26065 (plasmid) [Bordetella flabilis]|uniref:Uncharacterized protein n=1 Tax=Bordetella flabilis TaxID=463014 RepID=A0A193GLQ3_9BORD|nr:hypothetical protein BAU07_26065 [Bordetella flabilis]
MGVSGVSQRPHEQKIFTREIHFWEAPLGGLAHVFVVPTLEIQSVPSKRLDVAARVHLQQSPTIWELGRINQSLRSHVVAPGADTARLAMMFSGIGQKICP